MIRYILLVILCFAYGTGGCVSARPLAKTEKYIVIIHDGKGKTEVFKTVNIKFVDSILTDRIGNGFQSLTDSLLKRSKFFQIRVEGLEIYAERKRP